MTTINDKPSEQDRPPLDALGVLRQEITNLSPRAARLAVVYVNTVGLPDVWVSTLLLDLDAHAGSEPGPDILTTMLDLGLPGRWNRRSFDEDATSMAEFIAVVQGIAYIHAPQPPPVD